MAKRKSRREKREALREKWSKSRDRIVAEKVQEAIGLFADYKRDHLTADQIEVLESTNVLKTEEILETKQMSQETGILLGEVLSGFERILQDLGYSDRVIRSTMIAVGPPYFQYARLITTKDFETLRERHTSEEEAQREAVLDFHQAFMKWYRESKKSASNA